MESELQETFHPRCELGTLTDVLAHDFSLGCSNLKTPVMCMSAYCIATSIETRKICIYEEPFPCTKLLKYIQSVTYSMAL